MSDFKDWAKTPPCGWNSWDCFGAGVNEEQLIANADYMAKHLKQYGWEYSGTSLKHAVTITTTSPNFAVTNTADSFRHKIAFRAVKAARVLSRLPITFILSD